MIRQFKPHSIALRAVLSVAILASNLILTSLLPPSAGSLFASESYTPDDTAVLDPSVQFVQIGLTGDIETDILVTKSADKEAFILGTSKGLYIISEGSLQEYIATPGSVTDITLLNDVSGDGQQEIVIALDDTRFPNIRCYDGGSGGKLWQFAPRQDAFIENILWTEIETSTFDIETIGDVNSDGYQDIAATSGYGLYLLDGKTGEQIWRFDAEDNLWRVAIIPDINGDGIEELAAGAQTGLVYILDGKSGGLIWKKAISEQIAVYDDTGAKWASIDTSVWDIVPIEIGGKQKAIVSSEDGKVRLVNMKDGAYDWETTSALIEYSASQLYTYYRRKSKLPTSPGEANFFNLRLTTVADVSGDGVNDVLASAYVGLDSQQIAPGLNSGLYMINSASGDIIWSDISLDLGNVARIESATMDDDQVILLPQEKSNSEAQIKIVAIEDGELTDTLEITTPQSSGSSAYWTKAAAEDYFVTVSNYDDLLYISSEEEVQWYYPRISDVAVESGEFVGDDTEDLFIWSKQRLSSWGNKYGARILCVVDGATRSKVWSYEISYEDLEDIECIVDIQVTPDLNGDGKQDIIGYTKPRSSGETGEDYNIIAFSGDDGSILLNQPVVTQTYYGIYEQLYEAKDSNPSTLDDTVQNMLDSGVQSTYYSIYDGLSAKPYLKSIVDSFIQQILGDPVEDYDPNWTSSSEWMSNLEQNLDNNRQNRQINKKINSLDVMDLDGEKALVVGCHRDIFIIDSGGDLLWTNCYESWIYEDPFRNVQPNNWTMNSHHDTPYLSIGDLNDDNIDDLVACSWQSISVLVSEVNGGILTFVNDADESLVLFDSTEYGSEAGTDQSQVALVDDIDGDGIKEVFFPIHRPDVAQLATIASPATGDTLLQQEWHGGDLIMPSTDFNNDGSLDRIVFSQWREGVDGPVLEIVGGNNSGVIWQYDGYKEAWYFDRMGLTGITPAAAISDLNGDGIPDIAVTKFLTDQPGAIIDIYDATNNELLKEIITENIDERLKHWEKRWHPGVTIKEVGDYNGDGTNELAMVTMLTDEDSWQSGDSSEIQKEMWLMVVDVVNETAIAEFEILAMQFVETGSDKELAVVGSSGELYFLNMENNLGFTSPADGSSQSSPVTIAWEGVSTGAYNQIYIDDAEVARTNENEITLDIVRGEHQVVLRSMDEYGRGLYTSITLNVQKGSSIVIFVSIAFVISVLAITFPFLSRLVRYRLKESRHG